MTRFDIIICGGGPAGSTCALALAGSGLKVAVIDKAVFPRPKVCGDAIAAYVPKVLNSIHPGYAAALAAFTEKTEVDTCRVVAPNEKFIDIKSGESGYIIPRTALDHFLYQLAAAEPTISWRLNEEITDVSIDPASKEATVTTSRALLKAKIIIGCDGAHSVTGKKLTGTQPDLHHYSGAVRAYYKNVSGIPARTYELHFLSNVLPGYFWIFPVREDRANVGLCIPSYAIAKKKINLRQVMEEIIQSHPVIKTRFEKAERLGKIEGYGLPLGSRNSPVSGDHFMLCGDAASLIDPVTGEGIGQAMISGRYAGWQAIDCFKQNDFSAGFMKKYDQQLNNKLRSDFRKSYWMQRNICTRKWLFNGISNLVDSSKFLKRMLLKKVMKVADAK